MNYVFEDRSDDGVLEDSQHEASSYFNTHPVKYVIVPENYDPKVQSPHLSKQSREHSVHWISRILPPQIKNVGEYVSCTAKQSGIALPNDEISLLTDEFVRIGVIDKKVGGNGMGDKNLYRIRPEYMKRFKLFPITTKVALRKLAMAANE